MTVSIYANKKWRQVDTWTALTAYYNGQIVLICSARLAPCNPRNKPLFLDPSGEAKNERVATFKLNVFLHVERIRHAKLGRRIAFYVEVK